MTGLPELLPCPFCGGKAKIVEGEESAYVQCVEMKMHRALWFDGDNTAANEVVEQWNRRASPSQRPAVDGAERTVRKEWVRSMDQWRNMVPKAVAEGSQAQVEYALVDAKHDIEALWSALASLAPHGAASHGANSARWVKDDHLSPEDQAAKDVKEVSERHAPAIRAALTAAIGAGGQAVAWLWTNEYGKKVADIFMPSNISGAIPLYAHPSHPADERVVEALREAKNLLWRLQTVIEVDIDRNVRKRIADFDAFVDTLSAKEGR